MVTVLYGISAALMLLCLVMLVRNSIVFNYRSNLLSIIHDLCRDDIAHGRDWEWRYTMFNSVDYDEMCRKFWKRSSSFWKDKSFLEKGTN